MSVSPTLPGLASETLRAGAARLGRELIELCLYVGYFVALLTTYVRFFPETFAYEGYVDGFSAARAIVALPLIVVLAVAVQRTTAATRLFLHLGLMLVVVPMIVLYVGAGKSEAYLATAAASFVVMVGTVRMVRMVRLAPLRLLRVGPTTTLIGLLALSFGTLAAMGGLGGFRHFNLDLTRVYDFREEAAESLPGAFGYLVPAATKVFLPFALILALQRRSRVGVVAIAVAVVLFFGLASHKAILVYPLLAVALYAVAGSRWCAALFLLMLTALVLVTAVLLSFTEHPTALFFSSLTVRRGLILPAELTSTYLSWFDAHPHVFWAESKLSLGAIPSPYGMRVVNLIGLEFSGNVDMGANVGWVGSGYANAGLPGVLAYAVGIGLLIALLAGFAERLGARVVVAANAPLVVTVLYASDLVTSLLTHGLLVSLVLHACIRPACPRPKELRASSGAERTSPRHASEQRAPSTALPSIPPSAVQVPPS